VQNGNGSLLPTEGLNLESHIQQIERSYLLAALERSGGVSYARSGFAQNVVPLFPALCQEIRGLAARGPSRSLNSCGKIVILMNFRAIKPTDLGPFSLISAAVIYAFFAGLRTVADFDLGWQIATGRYIVQHHVIPSTELFSYTARGNPWIYPPFSGVIFYLLFLVGGYSALSWLSAIACAPPSC